MGLTVVTPNTTKPVSVDLAKEHLRVTHDHENAYIELLIQSAAQVIAETNSRALLNTVYDRTFDGFPVGRCIELRPVAASAITSIKYQDEDDTEQTFSDSSYTLDASRLVPAVYLDRDASWPATRSGELSTVTIRFTAGYGTAQTDVPPNARIAILMAVEVAYKIRSPVVTGTIVSTVSQTMDALLGPLWVPKV